MNEKMFIIWLGIRDFVNCRFRRIHTFNTWKNGKIYCSCGKDVNDYRNYT